MASYPAAALPGRVADLQQTVDIPHHRVDLAVCASSSIASVNNDKILHGGIPPGGTHE